MLSCESFSKENFIQMNPQSVRNQQQFHKREDILNERKFMNPFESRNKINIIQSQR